MHVSTDEQGNHFDTKRGRPGKAWSIPVLLLGTVVLGGALRLYAIGDKGLWLDEAFSVWMGWRSLPELTTWLVRIDQHPPLYYILLHVWLWFGDSAGHVRMLSAFLGSLTIPVIFLIGRRLAGDTVGLTAALLLALSPFHIRFAQETRMYTLLTLNASLAMLSLVYVLSDPRATNAWIGRQLRDFVRNWRRVRHAAQEGQTAPTGSSEEAAGLDHGPIRREVMVGTAALAQRRWQPVGAIGTDLAWIGYMVFTAATVLTHNTAIFFPLATNLFVLPFMAWRHSNRLPRPHAASNQIAILTPPRPASWLLAQIGAFLLWSPWLVPFVIQSMGVYAEFWIPSPNWQTVIETVKSFLCAFLPDRMAWANLVWAAFGIVTLLGIIHLRRRPATQVLLLVLFVTPIAGEWLVSLRRPIFYDRTLIWTTLPLYLILAAGMVQLRSRPLIVAGLLMLATIQGFSIRDYYNGFQKEQWREAAAYVAQNVADDDLILFNATWVQIPFDYYFRTANQRVAEHGVPVDLFDRGVLEPKMAESDLPRLRSLVRERDRVWLVYSHDWYTDPQRLIPATLEEELDLIDQQSFYGLSLRLYGASN
ncbi:MAG: glycosyltransferase family 39 protein [Caldilineaceae bacterium]|nr:glycosyltransferase family 39 protein [Caldilineaceae bacterium]